MATHFIFSDETGDFTFTRKPNVSKYFILCTVCMPDCEVRNDLIDLRQELVWQDAPLGDYFHASTDKQEIRDAVFETICKHEFTIQATIMEKSKAQPQIRIDRPFFYKTGWYFHFKHGVSHTIKKDCETLITAASIGTKKERLSFSNPVDDVMRQTMRTRNWKTDFRPASSDPCLQVADYCAWALHKKWEHNDLRSYELISNRITYEYDLWRRGTEHYY